jgi:biopolymer transport protein ExbD
MNCLKTYAALFVVSLLAAGCADSEIQSEASTQLPDSNTTASAQNEGIVKITVQTDGTVIVNSETVPIDSLASKLDSIGDIKEFWYFREAPDAAEPHENALKVITEIANRRLPIALFLDREFTQRATFEN